MSKAIFILTVILFSGVGSSIHAQQHSLKQLTFSTPTQDGYPFWSPDGNFILYGSATRETCRTMKIPAAGGTPVQVTDFFSQHAQLSPDGSHIVFDGEFGTKVQIVSSLGGTPSQIVPESIPIEQGGMPCWAPDGEKIAFTSKGDIWTLELKTRETTRIFHTENRSAVPSCWTPDGKNILIYLYDNVTREADIWTISVEDHKAQQLSFLEGYQAEPDISPDGSMIVFTSSHGGHKNLDLWIMPAEGGKPVQITFFPGEGLNPGRDIEPRWSPDGKKIAFTSTRTGYWAIWIMEPDIKYVKKKLRSRNK